MFRYNFKTGARVSSEDCTNGTVPHRFAKLKKPTGNYGLADAARIEYSHLILKIDPETGMPIFPKRKEEVILKKPAHVCIVPPEPVPPNPKRIASVWNTPGKVEERGQAAIEVFNGDVWRNWSADSGSDTESCSSRASASRYANSMWFYSMDDRDEEVEGDVNILYRHNREDPSGSSPVFELERGECDLPYVDYFFLGGSTAETFEEEEEDR